MRRRLLSLPLPTPDLLRDEEAFHAWRERTRQRFWPRMMSGLSGLSGLSGVMGGAVAALAPNQVSNLTLWLKADAGTFQDTGNTTPASADNDPVGSWRDQSGGGLDVQQGTSTKRPLLKLNVLNGNPG